MKTLFNTILVLSLCSCATKTALLETPSDKQKKPCSLTDTNKCDRPADQKTASSDEIKPFFESVGPLATFDRNTQEPPIDTEGLEAELQDETTDDGIIEFDIPVVMNASVEKWINYFQTRGKKYYAAWLERSGKYIPMMQNILAEHGLPKDLVYLSMIESGFKPYAYSRARAMGPWQFIRGTGSRYGLRVNWWIDERRDPEKSTIAAAQHLKDLYDQFNHWYLAAAGYNAGAMKITRAIKRYSTDDFWEMSQAKFRYLKPETKNYVPKLLAAAMIAKKPEDYGFTDINYEEPLQYTKVHVPESIELSVVAQVLDIDRDTLVGLNPELLRGVTPPNFPDYEMKLPVGKDKLFLEKYSEIREKSATQVARYVVRRNDTLGGIARHHRVSIRAIMGINKLRSSRIYPGQSLIIPGNVRKEPTSRTKVKKSPKTQASVTKHRVKKGETLWSISQAYNVSISDLKSWNRVSNASEIMAGRRLTIYGEKSSENSLLHPKQPRQTPTWISYKIRRGDSLWTISKNHGVTIGDLRTWNELENGKIYPGRTLKIKAN
ncbi:MAG: LysM peptidoglycan-binding domain-containing protein [Bdellovibrionales bacterium]|nr:LysM peptidoglycan-binding domain-containing protein [Bdellovibrionales bacterium]